MTTKQSELASNIATCNICLLAVGMRDCQRCKFRHVAEVSFTERLPDWYLEAEAKSQESLESKTAGVYMQERADWLSEKQDQAWLIGGDVVFGSPEWFEQIPEIEV